MEQQNIERILQKYRSGQALNKEEKIILDNYYLHVANQSQSKLSDDELQINLKQITSNVLGKTRQPRTKKLRTLWYSSAAAILITTTIATILYRYQSINTYNTEQQAQFEAIHAGSDKALLVLANGEQFALDGNTTIASGQGDILIDGQNLNLLEKGISSSSLNTLEIPRGGQFKVVLSDGSEVWLNAGSQLRYPTTFTGDSREVELIGEAYFQVKHNPKKPFKVHTEDQHIQVLGTSFNISSYPNTTTSTTLAHGKVSVSNGLNSILPSLILAPGEQAVSTSGKLLKQNADIAKVTAWKDGLFKFQKSSVQDITAQLERWYDIKFVFKNKTIPARQITGEIPRKVNLSDIVEILSYFDINSQIDGRTIYLDIKK